MLILVLLVSFRCDIYIYVMQISINILQCKTQCFTFKSNYVFLYHKGALVGKRNIHILYLLITLVKAFGFIHELSVRPQASEPLGTSPRSGDTRPGYEICMNLQFSSSCTRFISWKIVYLLPYCLFILGRPLGIVADTFVVCRSPLHRSIEHS